MHIVGYEPLSEPFGQGLPVAAQHQSALVGSVLQVAQFDVDGNGCGMVEHVEVAWSHSTFESPVGLVFVVLLFESAFHGLCQPAAVLAAVGMVEEHIYALAAAAAVNVQEDAAAILVALAVFAIQFVYLVAPLLQPLHLPQGDGGAHAGLAFAVVQIAVVAYTVLAVLYDDAHFGSLLHQVACQAQGYVVGILVFVQAMLSGPTYGTGIGTSVSTHYVETCPFEPVASHLHVSQFRAKEGFVQGGACVLGLVACFLTWRGSREWRQDVGHPQQQLTFAPQPLPVEADELFVLGTAGASVALQKG